MGKCIVKTIQSLSVSFFLFTVCICVRVFRCIIYSQQLSTLVFGCKLQNMYVYGMEPTVNKNHSKFDQKLCFPKKNHYFQTKIQLWDHSIKYQHFALQANNLQRLTH